MKLKFGVQIIVFTTLLLADAALLSTLVMLSGVKLFGGVTILETNPLILNSELALTFGFFLFAVFTTVVFFRWMWSHGD